MTSTAEEFDFSGYEDKNIRLNVAVPPSGHSVAMGEFDPYGMTHNIVTRSSWALAIGSLGGLVKGMYDGYFEGRKSKTISASPKLLLTNVLNSGARSAGLYGNHLGCFAAAYSLTRQYFVTKFPHDTYIADTIGCAAAYGFMNIYKGPFTATAMAVLGGAVGLTFFRTLKTFGYMEAKDKKSL